MHFGGVVLDFVKVHCGVVGFSCRYINNVCTDVYYLLNIEGLSNITIGKFYYVRSQRKSTPNAYAQPVCN